MDLSVVVVVVVQKDKKGKNQIRRQESPPASQATSALTTSQPTSPSQSLSATAPANSASLPSPPLPHPRSPTVSQPHTSPLTFSHPHCNVPIIKHIPKSARSACCSLLSETLRAITRSPDDLTAWSNLLQFGRSILFKPTRGGKKHNLASTIKKRTTDTSAIVSEPQVSDSSSRKRQSPAAALAATVSAKIEDGNIRAAVRLICSEDKPAPDTDATFMKLQEKHPAASVRTNPLPDPACTPALQVSEADVLKAIPAPFLRALLADLTDSDRNMLWIWLDVRNQAQTCCLLSQPSPTCYLMVNATEMLCQFFWGHPHRFRDEIRRHQTDRHWLNLETHCL